MLVNRAAHVTHDVCASYAYKNKFTLLEKITSIYLKVFQWFLKKVSCLCVQGPDGNVLVRSDARVSSLTLKYIQYTDAGEYLCTARNSIGETAQSVNLEVLCESGAPLASISSVYCLISLKGKCLAALCLACQDTEFGCSPESIWQLFTMLQLKCINIQGVTLRFFIS